MILCVAGIFRIATAQTLADYTNQDSSRFRVVASVPKVLKEASGLELTSSGLLWTHNDDRFPILYGLDTAGNIVRTIHLNHPNKGWEDLTQDEKGNLYIGAFGNNKNDRRDLEILKIPPPDDITDVIINAEVIRFHYHDQYGYPPPADKKNFDADAFVSIGDSLYIFSKNRTRPFSGYSKIYRLPSSPGVYEAALHDSLYLGNDEELLNWVTSADISPDGKSLVLLSHDCVWLVSGFADRRFSTGSIRKVNLNNFSHKAGVCFASDNRLYIIDELELGFLGGKLYVLDFLKPGNSTSENPRDINEKAAN